MDVVTALDRLPQVELRHHVEDDATGHGRRARPQERHRAADLGPHRAVPVLEPRHLLEIFWLVQSTLRSREDWARLAYESIVDGAAHGLVYRETFFTPPGTWTPGRTWPTSWPGWPRTGGGRGRDRCAGDADRRHRPLRRGGGPDHGPAAGRGAARGGERRGRAGAGVELDSTELGVDPTDFADAFELAGKVGLRPDLAPGEETPPSRIWAGLDVLGSSASTMGCRACRTELTLRLAGERIRSPSAPTPTW